MKTLCKSIALISILISGASQAEVVLNGFANIVAGMTSSSDEELYDFDDSLDFETGSLLAIQASSDLGNGLGVTAQIMSRGWITGRQTLNGHS